MRYLILVLFATIICFDIGYAQNFNIRTRYDRPAAVSTQLITKDSNFYSIGVITENEAPFDGGLKIVNYDTDGNLLEQIFLFDSLSDILFFFPSLHFESDTTFYATGEINNDSLYARPYIMKGNLDGEILWQKTYDYPIPDYDYFLNVGMVFHNNKFYLANRIRFYGQQENMNLQIIDTSGTLLENKLIPLDDWGRLLSIDVWNDQIILGGSRYTGIPLETNYKSQSLLVATDTLGNKLWEWVHPFPELTNGVGDMVVADNGHLVFIHTLGEVDVVNSSTSIIKTKEYMISELDEDLNIVWQTRMNESDFLSGYEAFSTLHKCKDGSGYLAGGSTYILAPDLTGTVLGYLAKVSTTGDSLWARKVLYYENEEELDSLSPFFHTIYDIDETVDGDILIGGEALENNYYPQQAWIAKVDEYGCHVPGCQLIDAIVDVPLPDFELAIFPNPTTDVLNVYLPKFEVKHKSELLLFNTSGQLLKSFPANYGNTNYVLPLSKMPSGAYFLTWRVDGKIYATENLLIGKL